MKSAERPSSPTANPRQMKEKPQGKSPSANGGSVERRVRHLAAQYLKYLRKEVRQTDGKFFPCSWPWLGMIADEARDKLKPIASDNGIQWSEVQLLANADRLANVK